MSLILRDLVYQVRARLGEQLPNYWYQGELIQELNWALQDMCSDAQNLETFVQFNWPAGTEEQPLGLNMDTILDVSVYQGQQFQLEPLADFADVQNANRVSGIPQAFYTKPGTSVMSPQGSPAQPTGNITPQQIWNPGDAPEAHSVLGLWPIPAAAIPVNVWGTRFHPWVKDPVSPIWIPPRFAKGPIYKAVAAGKEKEGFPDEADRFEAKYDKVKQEMNFWCIGRRQVKAPPNYGGTAWPTLARGSSSVIFVDQNPGLINQ